MKLAELRVNVSSMSHNDLSVSREHVEINMVSVVIPVFNEAENVSELFSSLEREMTNLGVNFEIIFVNDGSTDSTGESLRMLAAKSPNTKVLLLNRRYGQSHALRIGIHEAIGDVTVILDGDNQNDPADIAVLLKKIEEGFDLAFGWRKSRKDNFFLRKIPSYLANKIIWYATKFRAHDIGCGIKAMRSEVAKRIFLYGSMHRYIPVYAYLEGAKCIEVPVQHRPRTRGKSKYGILRVLNVIPDIITIVFFVNFLKAPMRLFGVMGLPLILGGLLGLCITAYMKIFNAFDITGNPLTFISGLLLLTGIQLLCLGLLGEVSVRIYFKSQEYYAQRKISNQA